MRARLESGRRGCRFVRVDVVSAILSDGRLGGPWFDEATLDGESLASLREQLALIPPDFSGREIHMELAVFRFPIGGEIRRHSERLLAWSAGGALPEPSPWSRWKGNGFAPGFRERIEHFLMPIPMPAGTELGVWDSGAFIAELRYDRGEWSAA